MTVKTITNPPYEPVSLAEARRWLGLRADDTAHTAVLQLLIQAMREDAEHRTLRAYVPRQLRLYLADWPAGSCYGIQIDLPYPPLVSVDSFQYVDTDGVTQTLAASQYEVHDQEIPAIIVPAWDVTWPTIRRVPDAIQVTYTAGYSPGSPQDEAAYQEVLPEKLRLWMQTKLATLFENREQIITGTWVQAVPRDFTDGLLDSLTVGQRLF